MQVLRLNLALQKHNACFLRRFLKSDNTNIFMILALEDLIAVFCAPLNMPHAFTHGVLVCEVFAISHWASPPFWWGSPLYQTQEESGETAIKTPFIPDLKVGRLRTKK